jgi:hypothetical protein
VEIEVGQQSPDLDTRRKPPTVVVLVLLAAVAAVFSYLAAYAAADALVAAEVLPPWPADSDPRPRWMLGSFLGVMVVLGLGAAVARRMSRRHMQRIDAMDDEAKTED